MSSGTLSMHGMKFFGWDGPAAVPSAEISCGFDGRTRQNLGGLNAEILSVNTRSEPPSNYRRLRRQDR